MKHGEQVPSRLGAYTRDHSFANFPAARVVLEELAWIIIYRSALRLCASFLAMGANVGRENLILFPWKRIPSISQRVFVTGI